MAIYQVEKRFSWQGPLSERAVQICRMFGLTIDRLTDRAATHRCRVDIRPGDIVYLTGPSGAGKSVLLRELERCVSAAEAINLAGIEVPGDRTVVDCFDSDVVTSLRTLSTVGLSDVFSLLNRPCWLSEGQQYRFRLARALTAGRPFLFADEFCSALDRVTAATVAFNVHRLAKHRGTTLVLASSRNDILVDLAPDVLIVKDFSGPADVVYQRGRREEV